MVDGLRPAPPQPPAALRERCPRRAHQEFTRQLQNDYGLDPVSGHVVPLDSLRHLDDARRETARILRETLAHFLSTSPSGGHREALDRIVREQAFTVLNRLAALRLARRGARWSSRWEAATIPRAFSCMPGWRAARSGRPATPIAAISSAYSTNWRSTSRCCSTVTRPGAPLPARAGPAGGAPAHQRSRHRAAVGRGRDHRVDLPVLQLQGRAEKDARGGQAPRNSRELAVRNQFFTPRYVVEFLADNTLGRMWLNEMGEQTALRERCGYLVS